MPQFDFYSFANQSLWFLIFFLLIYFFLLFFYMVRISEQLKMREKLNYIYSLRKNKKALDLYSIILSKVFKIKS